MKNLERQQKAKEFFDKQPDEFYYHVFDYDDYETYCQDKEGDWVAYDYDKVGDMCFCYQYYIIIDTLCFMYIITNK